MTDFLTDFYFHLRVFGKDSTMKKYQLEKVNCVKTSHQTNVSRNVLIEDFINY